MEKSSNNPLIEQCKDNFSNGANLKEPIFHVPQVLYLNQVLELLGSPHLASWFWTKINLKTLKEAMQSKEKIKCILDAELQDFWQKEKTDFLNFFVSQAN